MDMALSVQPSEPPEVFLGGIERIDRFGERVAMQNGSGGWW